MKHPTEVVYDEEMAPLVSELIAIAKRAGLPLLVSAGMVLEDGPGCCTTLVDTQVPELAGAENRLALSTGIIRGDSRFDRVAGMAITRYHPTPKASA